MGKMGWGVGLVMGLIALPAGAAEDIACFDTEVPIEQLLCNDPVLWEWDDLLAQRSGGAGADKKTIGRSLDRAAWRAEVAQACGLPAQGGTFWRVDQWAVTPCVLERYRQQLGEAVTPFDLETTAVAHPLCLSGALMSFDAQETTPSQRFAACQRGSRHIPVGNDSGADNTLEAYGLDLGISIWTGAEGLGTLPDGRQAALIQFNSGGTGLFSSIVAYDLASASLEPLIGGGDRCMGGISHAAYEAEAQRWRVRYWATPADVGSVLGLSLDLPACAVCCVAEQEVLFSATGQEMGDATALYREPSLETFEPETAAELCLSEALERQPNTIKASAFPALRDQVLACLRARGG